MIKLILFILVLSTSLYAKLNCAGLVSYEVLISSSHPNLARVVFLGNNHLNTDHHALNESFLNGRLRPDDVVLMEGLDRGRKMDSRRVPELSNLVLPTVTGWDNTALLAANRRTVRIQFIMIEFMFSVRETLEHWPTLGKLMNDEIDRIRSLDAQFDKLRHRSLLLAVRDGLRTHRRVYAISGTEHIRPEVNPETFAELSDADYVSLKPRTESPRDVAAVRAYFPEIDIESQFFGETSFEKVVKLLRAEYRRAMAVIEEEGARLSVSKKH